jgi:hypothetical protein
MQAGREDATLIENKAVAWPDITGEVPEGVVAKYLALPRDHEHP